MSYGQTENFQIFLGNHTEASSVNRFKEPLLKKNNSSFSETCKLHSSLNDKGLILSLSFLLPNRNLKQETREPNMESYVQNVPTHLLNLLRTYAITKEEKHTHILNMWVESSWAHKKPLKMSSGVDLDEWHLKRVSTTVAIMPQAHFHSHVLSMTQRATAEVKPAPSQQWPRNYNPTLPSVAVRESPFHVPQSLRAQPAGTASEDPEFCFSVSQANQVLSICHERQAALLPLFPQSKQFAGLQWMSFASFLLPSKQKDLSYFTVMMQKSASKGILMFKKISNFRPPKGSSLAWVKCQGYY